MKIRISYVYPPIPPREYDYSAMFDCDDGDSGRVGFGRTEQEAARDLLDTEYEFLVSRALRCWDEYLLAGESAEGPFTVDDKLAELRSVMSLLRLADTKDAPVAADLMA